MPLKRSYSKQTAREALHWLKEQKEDWTKQIQDADVAVQLYLNFKNRKRMESKGFCRELKALSAGDGTRLLKIQKTNSDTALPPETAVRPPADFYSAALFSDPDLNRFDLKFQDSDRMDSRVRGSFGLPGASQNRTHNHKKQKPKNSNQGSINPPPDAISQEDPAEKNSMENGSFPDALPLNEKNREILAQTARRLNLDRETEALNILIQFGFASLKTLIKDL